MFVLSRLWDEVGVALPIDHTNPPDWPLGREGHRQILALYHAAFPDFRYDIEHEVAEEALVRPE